MKTDAELMSDGDEVIFAIVVERLRERFMETLREWERRQVRALLLRTRDGFERLIEWRGKRLPPVFETPLHNFARIGFALDEPGPITPEPIPIRRYERAHWHDDECTVMLYLEMAE